MKDNTKPKILIIDDEESLRLTFMNFLLDEGYEVEIAENYNDAMALIEKMSFDIIVTDIILKGKTGIDVLKEVRKRNILCPVIVITGAPDVQTASEVVRLGAFDYITKPVLHDVLVRITKNALQQKILADENEKYRSNLHAIFKSVSDAIITVNKELYVIGANNAAKEICGVMYESGENPKYFQPEGCNKKCLDAVQETITKQQPAKIYRLECNRIHRNKQVVNIIVHPLHEGNNVSSGAVLVVRDETHLDELERNMKERKRFQNIVGKSKKMQEIYSLIDDFADVQTTVLITGESGTGKELIADALHYKSIRSNKPLVKVNCSALSEHLLESELFGHVKGAFTGAVNDREGRFQKANGGTIFFDEIGDISHSIQLKLLRVLQEKTFERVGDSVPIKVDVRIIAATHQDLLKKIRRGEFREDLYYRLKVVEVYLPPLRERFEDIELLAAHFLEKFNTAYNRNIQAISQNVISLFLEYSWPGNVRELQHTLEQAFIRCKNNTITTEHLPELFRNMDGFKNVYAGVPGIDEAQKILMVLEKTAWNKVKAARLLGISRQHLYRKMKEYDIGQ